MVIKGEIQSIDFTNNRCMVRLPFFESSAGEEVIASALFSNTPGSYNGYKEGDIVYVAFENGEMHNPVIIGKLYLGAAIEEQDNRGTINCTDFKATNSAAIPLTTKIIYNPNENYVEDADGKVKFKTIADLISGIKEKQDSINFNQTIIEDAPIIYGLTTNGNSYNFASGSSGSGNVSTTVTLTADKLILGAGSTNIKKSSVSINDITLNSDLPEVSFNTTTISGAPTAQSITIGTDSYNFGGASGDYAVKNADNNFSSTQTITGNDDTPLNLKANHATWSNIALFNSSGTRLGNIGANGNSPYWWAGGSGTSGQIALSSDLPTKTSDLTNDSDFITNSSLSNYVDKTTNQTITGAKTFQNLFFEYSTDNTYNGGLYISNNNFQIAYYNDNEGIENTFHFPIDTRNNIDTTLATIDDVPTKTSDLTNDSNFITASYLAPVRLDQVICANHQFEFSTEVDFTKGIGIFTFGNTFSFINFYGLQENTIYKMPGTFVYNSSGAVVTTTINVKYESITVGKKITIWSGNSSFQMENGYTGALYYIKFCQ